ncbi:MAG: MBL fold metallo-hydrolase [Bacteroidota bacterium]
MISLKSFAFNPYQVNTYLLYDETGECLVIDPGCYFDKETDTLRLFIERQNLKPVRIMNTHSHFDHTIGNRFVSELYRVGIWLHEADIELYGKSSDSAKIFGLSVEPQPDPEGTIADNEIIRFGNSEIRAIHAPGHSEGSLLYYSEVQKFVICGDVLFSGSIGRTDLPGGNMETLLRTINTKLLVMDDETTVYCGHGPHTNIGMERRTNPFLDGSYL